ncbi:Serine/threonine-protein kinase CDG1 [Glycine max]|nr:Serine/threonine-protein kinase CDG1 [Glycine max]
MKNKRKETEMRCFRRLGGGARRHFQAPRFLSVVMVFTERRPPSAFANPASTTARVFTYEEILDATTDFNLEGLLGRGVFGSVYRCQLRNGQLDPSSKQGDKEFRQDVNLLSSLNYPNFVKLIGYAIGVFGPSYIGLREPVCVDHEKEHLDLRTRMLIAFGVAKGLRYLHKKEVIFRDLK